MNLQISFFHAVSYAVGPVNFFFKLTKVRTQSSITQYYTQAYTVRAYKNVIINMQFALKIQIHNDFTRQYNERYS